MLQNLLFQNKNEFNLLFEAASEGIIVVDSSQIIIAANTSVEKMFGYKEGEMINQPLTILIPSNYRPNHGAHFKSFMAHSEKRAMGQGRDLYGVRKDGTQFPVEAGLNPFLIKGEQYVMSLIIDITVRKENERQIVDLNAHLEDKIKLRTTELQESIQKLQSLNLNLEGEVQKRKLAERKIKVALQKDSTLPLQETGSHLF